MLDERALRACFPNLELEAKLGEGGQKWVYRATHPTEGPVVLKIIKPTQDPSRIKREVVAVQEVRSSRVPQILDTGHVVISKEEHVWIREQLVEGRTVRTLIPGTLATEGGTSLPLYEVLTLAEHMLEALADIERVRIVHRDVKPDNIIRSPEASYWLLDFGISRHLDLNSLTSTGLGGGLGTPGYAPPEQFQNSKQAIDARSDLFALGVTVAECVLGKHPFRSGARDHLEVSRRIVRGFSLPPISGDVNDAFRDFVNALMQPHQEHRPKSAEYAKLWFQDVTKAVRK